MENFDFILGIIGAAVLAIIPIVSLIIEKVGSDQAKERWGRAQLIIGRIFSVRTTESSKTGKAAWSAPVIGDPIHPDDRD